jgi:hypothetical protein
MPACSPRAIIRAARVNACSSFVSEICVCVLPRLKIEPANEDKSSGSNRGIVRFSSGIKNETPSEVVKENRNFAHNARRLSLITEEKPMLTTVMQTSLGYYHVTIIIFQLKSVLVCFHWNVNLRRE